MFRVTDHNTSANNTYFEFYCFCNQYARIRNAKKNRPALAAGLSKKKVLSDGYVFFHHRVIDAGTSFCILCRLRLDTGQVKSPARLPQQPVQAGYSLLPVPSLGFPPGPRNCSTCLRSAVFSRRVASRSNIMYFTPSRR